MTQRESEILEWITENPLISQQELAQRAGITRSSVSVHISNLMKKGYVSGKGYIVHGTNYAMVVGGVNMDIGGMPNQTPTMHDSNPGKVTMSLGGVGRNIAHNMALMGVDVRMITAFGDDMNAQKISTSCGELGIDITHSLTVPNGSTSTYLFVTDEKGDMVVAVSDMAIYQHVTPAFLETKKEVLNNARLIIADTNIPTESLEWLSKECSAPLFVDPVSTAKATKLTGILGYIHTLKPNKIEAELLSGVSITDDTSLKACANALLETGMERVFISLGGDGVYAAEKATGQHLHIPCYAGKMVNTTGCGDAFMGSLGWSWLEGLSLEESARAGLAASSIAMEGELTINSHMSADALKVRAQL